MVTHHDFLTFVMRIVQAFRSDWIDYRGDSYSDSYLSHYVTGCVVAENKFVSN